jgi:exopolysaccharide biosynthesis polyprenyl glycosylphosphotransferase
MLYHNVQVAARALRLLDVTAGVTAALVAASVMNPPPDNVIDLAPYTFGAFLAITLVAFLWLAVRFRLYHTRRTEHLAEELIVLSEVVCLSVGLGCLATHGLSENMPASIYWNVLALWLSTLIVLRVAMRLYVRQARSIGFDSRNWLVIGHNARTRDIVKNVRANPHYGIRIVSCVDFPESIGDGSTDREGFTGDVSGVIPTSIIENPEAIRAILGQQVFDEVVVTLPLRSHYDEIERIMEICAEAGLSIRLSPQAFHANGYATELTYLGDVPLVTHYNGPSNYGQLLAKRVIDVTGSAIGLIALSPIFAVAALIIKWDSPGPVFFRQTRVGLHGRHFEMIKFRSMVKEAPAIRETIAEENERDGTAFKIRDDVRITRVGKWMRKYHFDEFPQLWNVVVGDMSLVGPRPLPVKEAHGNEWWQRRRLTMPPGLSCLWQLEDDPNIPFREWMSMDMAYIDGWSIWLDLKIIFRTFVTVSRGKGW